MLRPLYITRNGFVSAFAVEYTPGRRGKEGKVNPLRP